MDDNKYMEIRIIKSIEEKFHLAPGNVQQIKEMYKDYSPNQIAISLGVTEPMVTSILNLLATNGIVEKEASILQTPPLNSRLSGRQIMKEREEKQGTQTTKRTYYKEEEREEGLLRYVPTDKVRIMVRKYLAEGKYNTTIRYLNQLITNQLSDVNFLTTLKTQVIKQRKEEQVKVLKERGLSHEQIAQKVEVPMHFVVRILGPEIIQDIPR